MADYKDKLDEWQRAARRKARELDEKFGIKERVEEGARVAQDAARRGAETLAGGAERVRAEASVRRRLTCASVRIVPQRKPRAKRVKAGEVVRKTAGAAERKAVRFSREINILRAASVQPAGASYTSLCGVDEGGSRRAKWIRRTARAAFVTFPLWRAPLGGPYPASMECFGRASALGDALSFPLTVCVT